MRKMFCPETDQTVEVTEHIILRNFWEYYVLNRHTNTQHTKFCLVLGAEDETGDVYLPEIAPFIISRTTDLQNVMPAPGWKWL